MSEDVTPATVHPDAAAEVAVLGAMMISPMFAQDAADELTATDFVTPAHRLVFFTIQKLLAGRMAVDAVIVAEQLREDGYLKDVEGAPFLHALVEGAPTSDTADRFLEIVRHAASLRGRSAGVTVCPIRSRGAHGCAA